MAAPEAPPPAPARRGPVLTALVLTLLPALAGCGDGNDERPRRVGVSGPAPAFAAVPQAVRERAADIRREHGWDPDAAMLAALAEYTTALEADIDRLALRLGQVVSQLLVTDTMQGACCARGRAQAARVIRIARGEDEPQAPADAGVGGEGP